MTTARYLAIIDRGYRGGVEVQFCDLPYLVRGLHGQLGGVDLVLRGSAVTFAVAGASAPGVLAGRRSAPVLPDQRRSLAALLCAGSSVFVDEPDLAVLGLGQDRLLEGVSCLDTSRLAEAWPNYQGVWFL
jgi:hypothetical protein